MKPAAQTAEPEDALERLSVKPVVCYPIESLPKPPVELYEKARSHLKLVETVVVPPREARCFRARRGQFFRVVSTEGSQVGDLDLFSAENPKEKFYSGKTRALHGTHLGRGDSLWSSFPWMRPMATITHDTLDWYKFDEYGGGVHDVIGTRCDPYTHWVLSGGENYHHCCHSNLVKAVAPELGISTEEAGHLVHDVLNVFMCTGFTSDTHQYFMKASPVRPGDFLEFVANIDILGCISACPGGDCSSEHSSDTAKCYPLIVEIYDTTVDIGPESAVNGYQPNY